MQTEQDFPIIGMVDTVLSQAVTQAASDIHFEPTPDHLRVRLRIDGVLYDHQTLNTAVMQQFLTRLKVLASINITQKRVPQDGKFRIMCGEREIDLRVSTFPTMYGEKIVVRILDRALHTISLENLGFADHMKEQIAAIIAKPSGFFLVSGPTGSGKTTTLYAALNAVNKPDKNIITLEDPVEYCVANVTQSQIHPEAGFTFEKGIRSLLRQDPDIIMVGEIRDKLTAGTAIEAALTGHLVFSTVHTNDAPGVVMRLMDMGIEPFLINEALTGVLAQRLARRICSQCKFQRAVTDQERELLKRFGSLLESVFEGKGCQQCLGLGVKGRVGIFQLLGMTSSLRSLIVRYPSFDDIYSQACADGMKTLIDDGLTKVEQGIISLSELERIIA